LTLQVDEKKLKLDNERIILLQWFHLILVVVSIFLHFSHGYSSFWMTLLKLIVCAFFYRMFFTTLRRLYYTYWSLALILFVFSTTQLIEAILVGKPPGITWCYFLTSLLIIVQSYLLNTPIYYPQVRWWEYDFRYRNDLKIKISVGDVEYEGRLTDLRKGAGCIVLFEELPLQSLFNLSTISDHRPIELEGEVMSKRAYSIGRGHIYGVRFHFDKPNERKEFDYFSRLWKFEQSVKASKRFSSIKKQKQLEDKNEDGNSENS